MTGTSPARPKWRRADTAFLLGGGPSLKAPDVDRLRGRGRTIAINNAYQLAPWADCYYWADRQWFEWHHAALTAYPATPKFTRAAPHIRHGVENVTVLDWGDRRALATEWGEIVGLDSGSNAINLAYLLGAGRIVLLGYDMRENGHWHPDHPNPVRHGIYAERYIPGLNLMAKALRPTGVQVLNASPGSALTCFPMIDLETLLDGGTV